MFSARWIFFSPSACFRSLLGLLQNETCCRFWDETSSYDLKRSRTKQNSETKLSFFFAWKVPVSLAAARFFGVACKASYDGTVLIVLAHVLWAPTQETYTPRNMFRPDFPFCSIWYACLTSRSSVFYEKWKAIFWKRKQVKRTWGIVLYQTELETQFVAFYGSDGRQQFAIGIRYDRYIFTETRVSISSTICHPMLSFKDYWSSNEKNVQ